MVKQKYFYILYMTCWSKLDNYYRDYMWGHYKNFEEANKKAQNFINNEKVKNINILTEKTGKIDVLKGVSLWDF